jgi:precorrin-6B methylase 2
MSNEDIPVDPGKIMQIGTGFWASKVLLAAVKFDLFTLLLTGAKSGAEIKMAIGWHDRSLYDFLDCLVSFGFLEREGLLETAKYSNAADVDMFLVSGKPAYVGGILQMCNNRLYGFWGDLEEALQTGMPQNESKNSDKSLFDAIYADEKILEKFLAAMGSVQMGNFATLGNKFDFSNHKRLCDMGGAGGFLSILVSQSNPHLSCTSFDLPPVLPIANKNIEAMGASDNVTAQAGDFFEDSFPTADVITMGNILHDWSEAEKVMLMQKAYDALPDGGVFIAIENVIDSDRRQNAFGLLMSLNMLIETTEGFDYSATDFEGWAKEVGFKSIKFMPLAGPSSAAIAYK